MNKEQLKEYFVTYKKLAKEKLHQIKHQIKNLTKISTWQDLLIPENPSEHPRLVRFIIFTMILMVTILGITVIIFFFIVRISIPTVRVPAVTNMDITQAISIVQSNNLNARFEMVYDHKHPKYQIISQYPKQGASVREGRSVNLIISLGEDKYTVPELSGLDKEAAIAILDRERIPYSIQVVPAGKQALNKVIAMDIPAGKVLPRDQILSITITDAILENQYRMHNFIRQPLEFAANTLYNNKITPIIVTTNVDSLSDDGLVLEQNIEEGRILQKNASAILTVGLYAYNDGEKDNLKWHFFSYNIPSAERIDQQIITNEDGTLEDAFDGEQPTAKFYKAVFEDELGRSRTIYERMGAEGTTFNRVFKAYGKATVYVYANDDIIGKQNYGEN